MRRDRAAGLITLTLIAGLLGAGPLLGQETAAPPPVSVPAEPPAAVLPPEAVALRDGLARELAEAPEAERAAIVGFFQKRGFSPFWTEGTERREALVAALRASGEQALPVRRYDPEGLAMLFAAADAPAARREAGAMRAYLRFAGDLSAGVLEPSAVVPEIGRDPVRPAPGLLLARLEAAPLPQVLAALEPDSPDYRRLVAEKRRLEALAGTESWGPAVPDGPTLHPGDRGPRVAELRARLARLGYGVPDGARDPGPLFDEALKRAVQRFQTDHGLIDDGVVGARTLAAINAPVEARTAQVIVNLERLRWMNRHLGTRYLSVNIPDFSVALYEEGRRVWSSKVVVGLPEKTETQEFSDVVTYMVVNPTWHIPDSIAIRDYLPKLQRDPMVLKRQNIRLLTRGGTEINPKLVDFTQYTPENFPFRIKQRPNDANALGQVKFMFPNEFSIYLHDTPHRELFARDARAFSNGCIRVEKPVELAHILLAGQVEDPAAAFSGWVVAKTERSVTLERPVPVHIVYRTVWFDEGGAARYRADIYRRDAKILDALEAAGVATLAAAQG